MRFKTKDLLVTVLPTAKNLDPEVAKRCLLQTNICARPTFQCPDPSLICRNPSVCLAPTHCGGCSLLVSCEPCSGIGTCRHSVCDCTFIASLPCGGLSCGGGSAC
nr:hypothetical protein [Thermoanaerobaculia bacterium]